MPDTPQHCQPTTNAFLQHTHRNKNNTLLFYLPSTSINQTRPEQTMASPTSPINTSVALMLLLLFLVRVHVDCSPSPSNSSSGDIGECSPQQLLPPLVPCLAFVQGMISSPSEPCCDSVVNLYLQHPKCLCVLLDDTITLPINRTLMLQLPLLCSLNSTSSSCPGMHLPPSSSSPAPQVHHASDANSSTAAPPVTKAPSVLNFYHSGSMQPQALQGGASLVMAVAAVILIGVFGLVFP
ncbi:protein YLS3 [Cinnamomum micranthum f. kanehirae]|uniref:Protein YLS3 n=1 Tax=Cinnamomum micranthum f. kanehirae TaxID=337451 RepID=A0A3S3N507_9MAGN|nr:protein YLS3 [Cinnamomum micranthum f. kanehirae]